MREKANIENKVNICEINRNISIFEKKYRIIDMEETEKNSYYIQRLSEKK